MVQAKLVEDYVMHDALGSLRYALCYGISVEMFARVLLG